MYICVDFVLCCSLTPVKQKYVEIIRYFKYWTRTKQWVFWLRDDQDSENYECRMQLVMEKHQNGVSRNYRRRYRRIDALFLIIFLTIVEHTDHITLVISTK